MSKEDQQTLEAINQELQSIEDQRGSIDPRIEELQEKRDRIREDLGLALADKALGRKDGHVDSLKSELGAIEGEIEDLELMAGSLEDLKVSMSAAEQRVRRKANLIEYHELVPSLQQDIDRYRSLRAEMRELSQAMNRKKSRLSSLMLSLNQSYEPGDPDLADLPNTPSVHWKDPQFGISREQLAGEKAW